jgi:hypothetical protein
MFTATNGLLFLNLQGTKMMWKQMPHAMRPNAIGRKNGPFCPAQPHEKWAAFVKNRILQAKESTLNIGGKVELEDRSQQHIRLPNWSCAFHQNITLYTPDNFHHSRGKTTSMAVAVTG